VDPGGDAGRLLADVMTGSAPTVAAALRIRFSSPLD
jgi:hypothetical protein